MSELKSCPLCGSEKIEQYPLSGGTDICRIICHRCKEYKATYDFLADSEKKYFIKNGFLLSGLARELYETENSPPEFSCSGMETQLKHYLISNIKSVSDKANKLLQRFREKSNHFGEVICTKPDPDFPLGYSKNQEEYEALIKLLEKKGLIDIVSISKNDEISGYSQYRITVTDSGWELSDTRENEDSNQVFIASWFDPSTNDSITAIERAVENVNLNLIPVCIKDEHFSEKIMDKALGEIRKSRFAIVDLTGNRNSVFFEIGFLYGLGKQCIFVFKKEGVGKNPDLEFYVKHYKCYEYESPEDLEEKLTNAISARYKKR